MAKSLKQLIAKLIPAEYWNQKYRIDEWLYTKVENRFVKELCAELTPGTAIDLAGGEGRNSMWLAKRGWTVENVDFSAVALKKFRRWVREESVHEPALAGRCLTTKADARGFKSKLAPADLGVIAYLQIDQYELAAAIGGLVGKLKPGATLVGVWHSLDNLAGGFGGPRDPNVLPSVDRIRAILSGLNVDIELLENREGQIQTKEGLKPSITLVLQARVRD
ncbi:MAG: hypothetical protein KGL41_06515 [Actinomycetales bacterium]|nr:hypothetical protein [Actinomycetales bacterium]